MIPYTDLLGKSHQECDCVQVVFEMLRRKHGAAFVCPVVMRDAERVLAEWVAKESSPWALLPMSPDLRQLQEGDVLQLESRKDAAGLAVVVDAGHRLALTSIIPTKGRRGGVRALRLTTIADSIVAMYRWKQD